MKAAAADKGTARQSTVPMSSHTLFFHRLCGRARLETQEQTGKAPQCGEAHHITYQGTAQRST